MSTSVNFQHCSSRLPESILISYQSETTGIHECLLRLFRYRLNNLSSETSGQYLLLRSRSPDRTLSVRLLKQPLYAPVFTPLPVIRLNMSFFKSCAKSETLLSASFYSCGVEICTNALKNTTMLRSPVVWNQLASDHHAEQCSRGIDRIEKLSIAPPGVKEDFVIYLVSQAWKSMF